MAPNTYTEEEFKKILKNLFVEKKKVKDLEKQLEEKGLQKRFQAKLADIHKFSLTEEYAKLKAALLEKETECTDLRSQLEKVRPALKKLMVDLKSAHQEIDSLKLRPFEIDEVKGELKSAQEALAQTEEKMRSLQATLENEQAALTLAESERIRLVERLSDNLNQMQRQSEMLQQQQEELARLNEWVNTARSAEYQHKAVREEKEALTATLAGLEAELIQNRALSEEQTKEIARLSALVEETRLELEESDVAKLRHEYEVKVESALIAFSQKEKSHEESLEQGYLKMREMAHKYAQLVEEREILYKKVEDHNKFLAKFEKDQGGLQSALKKAKLQCEELDNEVRKAQQHLAKKVKEATVLQDLAESQKIQIIELQTEVERHKSEAQLQKAHAENMHERYQSLQKEHLEAKEQLSELQKLRKTYEQMASTFSSLKTIIGHTVDPTAAEDTQDPRD